MDDELEMCVAAFFRIKGKDTVTANEFKMSVSLELKWMSVNEAERLMSALVSKGLLIKEGEYLKPSKDLSAVRVPMAYRPSESLKKSIPGTNEKKSAPVSAEPGTQTDVFSQMIEAAVARGIAKSKFVAESNALRKKLGVHTSVAALILLRDAGEDINKWKDLVYAQILR